MSSCVSLYQILFYCCFFFFFFNDTATTEIYTLSLHDALPIWIGKIDSNATHERGQGLDVDDLRGSHHHCLGDHRRRRSEEHTSELQSLAYLVCRLLLEKKKKQNKRDH